MTFFDIQELSGQQNYYLKKQKTYNEKLSLNKEGGISQERKFVTFTSKTKPDL
jgi:hypothetical protein